MIKLKIGDNYLITTNKDGLSQSFICYMMSRYKGHGRTALGFDPKHVNPNNLRAMNSEDIFRDYGQAIRDARLTSVDILFYKTVQPEFVRMLIHLLPNIKLKFIKVTKEDLCSREYKLAWQAADAWKLDKTSILSHLSELDEYKELSTRYKNIPNEIRTIDDSIRAMKKQSKEEGRKVTLRELEPLHLIENASLLGNELRLEIYPLYLNPSEPLGEVYDKSVFLDNPYMYNVAKYLYQGKYHFKMPGTKIKVYPNFIPEFIDTKNHDFDDMFEINNWSNVGYLHFGKGHLCGGEFNDVISHAGEYGLEYYFLALRQYITTANMRDTAGVRIWWYPIYDEEDNLVYCAGLDILRKAIMDSSSFSPEQKSRIADMSIQEFLDWKKSMGIKFREFSDKIPSKFRSSNQRTRSGRGDDFLEVLQEKEPELYKTIMKGRR